MRTVKSACLSSERCSDVHVDVHEGLVEGGVRGGRVAPQQRRGRGVQRLREGDGQRGTDLGVAGGKVQVPCHQ